jgi:hypothetical protein
MDKFLSFLERVPTTKIRILVTVFLILGTGVVYLHFACHNILPTGCVNWEPSSNWYIFLSALAGVDITQYAAKSFVGVKHAQIASLNTPTTVDDTAEPEEPTFRKTVETSTVVESAVPPTPASETHDPTLEQKG